MVRRGDWVRLTSYMILIRGSKARTVTRLQLLAVRSDCVEVLKEEEHKWMLTQRHPPSCGKVRVSDRAVLGETCLRHRSRGGAAVSHLELTFQSLSLWGHWCDLFEWPKKDGRIDTIYSLSHWCIPPLVKFIQREVSELPISNALTALSCTSGERQWGSRETWEMGPLV